jgi:membrane protease YdiL (CAAX protease family)
MKEHRLITFFVLTFAISWGVPGLALLLSALAEGFDVSLAAYSPLYYVGVWGPAIAALLLVGVTQGRAGLRAYASRLLQWRVGLPWYALALLGVSALNLCASLLTHTADTPALAVPTNPWQQVALAALLVATAGPMEELGWRGYALPLLQRRMSGLLAALLLGLIWGLWHFPALAMSGFAPGGPGAAETAFVVKAGQFLVGAVATSVVMTVLYNGTRGSIPLAFLFHWMTNFPYPWETGIDISRAQTLLFLFFALMLGLTLGRRYLGRANLRTEVTPRSSGF